MANLHLVAVFYTVTGLLYVRARRLVCTRQATRPRQCRYQTVLHVQLGWAVLWNRHINLKLYGMEVWGAEP